MVTLKDWINGRTTELINPIRSFPLSSLFATRSFYTHIIPIPLPTAIHFFIHIPIPSLPTSSLPPLYQMVIPRSPSPSPISFLFSHEALPAYFKWFCAGKSWLGMLKKIDSNIRSQLEEYYAEFYKANVWETQFEGDGTQRWSKWQNSSPGTQLNRAALLYHTI
jgi:hypothetical protein